MYFFLEGKHPADTFQRHIILIRKPSLSSLFLSLPVTPIRYDSRLNMPFKPVKKITSIYLQMIIQSVPFRYRI